MKPGWSVDIWFRMRRHFLLKLVGTTACNWFFFIGYFHVLRFPAYPVTLMPLTALDHLIPFEPLGLFPYLTLWLYLGFVPGLQRTFLELVVYAGWLGGMCLTGLVFFYFWPTAVPPLTPDVSDFVGFAMLQGVDSAGNACPSLHVAVAIFTVIRMEALLREVGTPMGWRVFNLVWFLLIVWSTMAIKQHVALDVLAGAVLGMGFAWMSLRWRLGTTASLVTGGLNHPSVD